MVQGQDGAPSPGARRRGEGARRGRRGDREARGDRPRRCREDGKKIEQSRWPPSVRCAQNLELQSRPWRDARARRTKGVDWTPTHKPIFISYAPTQDATYDELAFCQKMVETLNEIQDSAHRR